MRLCVDDTKCVGIGLCEARLPELIAVSDDGFAVGAPGLWLQGALVVVVAASPSALAISVPVTVVASIGAASRRGILVKGGAAMEVLGKVRTVALDKTGTLTRNQPVVIEVTTTGPHTREQVLAWAAAEASLDPVSGLLKSLDD